MIMMTIHGVVQTTMRPMNALTDASRSVSSRPTRMNTNAIEPMNSDAWTRLKRGNTDEKSRPVPYRLVMPVDMPPRNATTMSGNVNHSGETWTSATT